MAVIVLTTSPKALWSSIQTAITQGRIETWQFDSDGDLSHTPPQWINKAWFRPSVQNDKLAFALWGVKGTAMTKVVYGVYHGRWIESLLTHFDTQFPQVYATGGRDPIDNFL